MSLQQANSKLENGFWPVGSRSVVQGHKSSARLLQIILDCVIVVALLYLHTWLKEDTLFDSRYRALAVLVVLLMLVIYPLCGVYRLNLPVLERTLRLMQAWALVIGAIVFAGFVTKTSAEFSREIVLTWTVTGFAAQVGVYFLVWYAQKADQRKSVPTLVVGGGPLAAYLIDHINTNPWIPDHVVSVAADHIDSPSRDDISTGTLDEVEQLVDQHGVKRVYLAMPMGDSEKLKPLYEALSLRQVDVIWAPDIFDVELLNHSVGELGGVPIISLSESPHIGTDAFVKRLMDYLIASVVLILTLPITFLTAILIKLSSPGPVFFRQQRLGFDGEEFSVYKFRSMVLHDETQGTVVQASREDDRVTFIGRIIRRTSIDELPQLLNVLKGNMSLVGPRPHAVSHDKYYSQQIKDYMRRHRVKPGMTGLAQVNGYRGETRQLEQMEARVKHDIAYINNWSVWLDIKIITKTLFVLLDTNAY